jgi:uncharacterized protein YndB with AHSA1/START domain
MSFKTKFYRGFPGRSRDEIWSALTEPGRIGAWLMPGDISAVPGHRFTLDAKAAGRWEAGDIACEVLEAEKPEKLVLAWKVKGQNSRVSFYLLEKHGGTQVSVIHDGFTGLMGAFCAMAYKGLWSRAMALGLQQHLDSGANP